MRLVEFRVALVMLGTGMVKGDMCLLKEGIRMVEEVITIFRHVKLKN